MGNKWDESYDWTSILFEENFQAVAQGGAISLLELRNSCELGYTKAASL